MTVDARRAGTPASDANEDMPLAAFLRARGAGAAEAEKAAAAVRAAASFDPRRR